LLDPNVRFDKNCRIEINSSQILIFQTAFCLMYEHFVSFVYLGVFFLSIKREKKTVNLVFFFPDFY